MLDDGKNTSQSQLSPSQSRRIPGYSRDNRPPPHTNTLDAHKSLRWQSLLKLSYQPSRENDRRRNSTAFFMNGGAIDVSSLLSSCHPKDDHIGSDRIRHEPPLCERRDGVTMLLVGVTKPDSPVFSSELTH